VLQAENCFDFVNKSWVPSS